MEMKKLYCIAASLFSFALAQAQEATPKKTIDITSTFKPALLNSSKTSFTASAAPGDTSRPALQYSVPVQNLSFAFSPLPLKPLAYETNPLEKPGNNTYIKLGFGNFTTPYVKAATAFGDGVKSNGSVEGDFISSKGKMPFQQYARYGIKGSAILNVNETNDLRIGAGFGGFQTYRYGYQPDSLVFPKDSLKLGYTDYSAAASFSNRRNTAAALWYDPSIAIHFFADNHEAREFQFNFAVPLEKKFSDNLALQVGLNGMLSSFNGEYSSFKNNLFQVRAAVKTVLAEKVHLSAGIIPSWNNSQFKLLPDVEADFLINGSSFVFQAGWKGYYQEQTFRTLVQFNPWIKQPDSLTNTSNSEFYGAVKAVLDEHFSFRVKAGYRLLSNVPLFANNRGDGKTFYVINEAKMNAFNLTGELTWIKGEQFQWYNSLALNTYGGIDSASKAYGLLPFELKSSMRAKLIKDLYLKADLYNFAATWYPDKENGVKRSGSAFDLNAGLEFKLVKNIDLWVQFNNILNQKYERWNQYPVLGFQVLGGVIIHL